MVALDVGGTLAFWSGDATRLVGRASQERAPTHLPSVPRVYEKIHTAVVGGVAEQRRRQAEHLPLGARRRARRARRTPSATAPGAARRGRGQPGSPTGSCCRRCATLFGDRLAAGDHRRRADRRPRCSSSSTPAASPSLEGYGMTETCAAAHAQHRRERCARHASGRPLPGTEVRDRRRRRDPDARAARLRRLLTERGGHERDAAPTAGCTPATSARSTTTATCTITGRKKDLIITSSGKNISPTNIESALRETPLDLRRRSSYGDRRSYLVALLTLDPDEAPQLAEQLGVPARPGRMATDERVREAIQTDGRRRQPALRADRADQALRDPRPRPLAGGGRADADAEGQARASSTSATPTASSGSTRG